MSCEFVSLGNQHIDLSSSFFSIIYSDSCCFHCTKRGRGSTTHSSLTQEGYKHQQIRCNVDCLSTVNRCFIFSTVQQKHHRICLHIYFHFALLFLSTKKVFPPHTLAGSHQQSNNISSDSVRICLDSMFPVVENMSFVHLITKNPEEGQSVLSGGPLRLSVSGQRVYFLKLQEDVVSRKHHEQRCDWEKLLLPSTHANTLGL